MEKIQRHKPMIIGKASNGYAVAEVTAQTREELRILRNRKGRIIQIWVPRSEWHLV